MFNLGIVRIDWPWVQGDWNTRANLCNITFRDCRMMRFQRRTAPEPWEPNFTWHIRTQLSW